MLQMVQIIVQLFNYVNYIYMLIFGNALVGHVPRWKNVCKNRYLVIFLVGKIKSPLRFALISFHLVQLEMCNPLPHRKCVSLPHKLVKLKTLVNINRNFYFLGEFWQIFVSPVNWGCSHHQRKHGLATFRNVCESTVSCFQNHHQGIEAEVYWTLIKLYMYIEGL